MADERRREEFFPACAEVAVDQLGGRVEVRGWGENRIRLVSTPREEGARVRVVASRHGNRLTVAVERVGVRFWGTPEDQADLELWVPRSTSLAVDAGAGPVTVEGIHSRVAVETGSGNITVRDGSGPLSLEAGTGTIRVEDCESAASLETGSGTIGVTGVRGRLDMETGCGDIEAIGVTGLLRIETGSGSIRVERLRGDLALEGGSGGAVLRDLVASRLAVEFGSGDVEVEGYPTEGAQWSIDTGSGDVKLAIPESAACLINAATGGGGIDCRLPVEAREAGPRTLKGVLNRAGGSIRVSTGSGTVVLSPLAGEWPAPEREARPQDESWLSVLRMVEEGKITPAEADALLAALADSPSPGEAGEAVTGGETTGTGEPEEAGPEPSPHGGGQR